MICVKYLQNNLEEVDEMSNRVGTVFIKVRDAITKNVKGFGKVVFSMSRLLRSFKIRTRLVVAFLLLSLIPVSIVGFMSINKSGESIKSKISMYSQQLILQAGHNIDNEIKKYENLCYEIVASKNIHDVLKKHEKIEITEILDFQKAMVSLLKAKSEANPEINYAEVLLYDNISAGAGIKQISASESQRLKSEALGSTEDFVWEIAVDDTGAAKYLTVTQKVLSPDDL